MTRADVIALLCIVLAAVATLFGLYVVASP